MLVLRKPLFTVTLLVLFLFASGAVFAQQVGTVQGTVTDDSGAVIPGAVVTATGPNGRQKSVSTNENGAYTVSGLAPGKYTIRVTSKGFANFEQANVDVAAGRPVTMDAALKVFLANQEVTVQSEQVNTVSTDPTANAGALVLRGDDLQALSDDPDDLAADLQALAGPAAGPNGAQIFVDGFSGSRLPPKESIREIRINSNPFAAEYDRLGFGRIEILTKPGTDKFHGSANFNYSDGIFNSRNPFDFSSTKAPFQSRQYGGFLGGPLSKKSSFFVDVEGRNVNDDAVVNATILDPSFNIVPFGQSIATPQTRISVVPRIDYQLTSNVTLVTRYNFTHFNNENSGIGNFALPTRGINSGMDEHTLQVTETAILGSKAVNETRFQYLRMNNASNAVSNDPTINVIGAFNGGGAQTGSAYNTQNNFELTNTTSIIHGTHAFKLGGRLRYASNSDFSPANFGGTFTFGGGVGPQLDQNLQIVRDASGQPVIGNVTAIDRYRRTLLLLRQGVSSADIRNLYGGGATQFTIAGGTPLADVNQTDLGIFVQDDWRVKPNFTLSLGLRYETQTNIHDWKDIGPRIGFAWAPGSKGARPGKTVIRGGAGMFYDRFGENFVLQSLRFNGVTQQQFIVTNPDFYPNPPSVQTLTSNRIGENIRSIASNLRAPYIMQTAIGVERQLPRNTTLAVTFTESRGVHMLRSRNISAPPPGTIITATNGNRFSTNDNLYEYESSGVLNQNQIITNLNSRVSSKMTIFTYYVLNHAKSDTDNAGTFPNNQYDLHSEYGRASFDIRHRFVLGGSLVAPWNVRFSPFIMANSGGPFNITTGTDVNGDSVFTDRPAFATDLTRSSVVVTRFGAFDTRPLPGQVIIPRNYAEGPGSFTVNLRASKTWGFGEPTGSAAVQNGGDGGPGGGDRGGRGGGGRGPGGGGPGGGGAGGMRMGGGGMRGMGEGGGNHRYNITLSISARNLLNHVNLGQPIGDLSSNRFGESNSIAGGFGPGGGGNSANNRRLDFQLRFSF